MGVPPLPPIVAKVPCGLPSQSEILGDPCEPGGQQLLLDEDDVVILLTNLVVVTILLFNRMTNNIKRRVQLVEVLTAKRQQLRGQV